MTSFITPHDDLLRNFTQSNYPKQKPEKPSRKCKRVNFSPEIINEEKYTFFNNRFLLELFNYFCI